jgi:hypothetical protein
LAYSLVKVRIDDKTGTVVKSASMHQELIWAIRCRRILLGTDESIRAVNATKSQAVHLGVAIDAASWLIIATGVHEGSVLRWHEETLYRSDVYDFRKQLGGGSSPKTTTTGHCEIDEKWSHP